MHDAWQVETDVHLLPHTTLRVGGKARYFAKIGDRAQLQQALAWARRAGYPVCVLGGGSNVVVADRGFDGLVLKLVLPGIALKRLPFGALLSCGAGVDWDAAVAYAVQENLAGIECLSGIPGSVGAAPVQNIGAYGQEVSQVLQDVHVIDRQDGQMHILPQASLGLGYRHSHFKSIWRQRFIVVQADMALVADAPACLSYPDVKALLGDVPASLSEARDVVLGLRRRKSMALAAHDENHRSVGSFFVNPVVSRPEADAVAARLGGGMPQFGLSDGRCKLSAAYLIEQAGFARGLRQGNVGLSSAHALCLVNHGGATATEVIDFAAGIVGGVQRSFGIKLVPEPDFIGFAPAELQHLAG